MKKDDRASTIKVAIISLGFVLAVVAIASKSPLLSEEYYAERDASIHARNAEMIENQAKFFGPLD